MSPIYVKLKRLFKEGTSGEAVSKSSLVFIRFRIWFICVVQHNIIQQNKRQDKETLPEFSRFLTRAKTGTVKWQGLLSGMTTLITFTLFDCIAHEDGVEGRQEWEVKGMWKIKREGHKWRINNVGKRRRWGQVELQGDEEWWGNTSSINSNTMYHCTLCRGVL